MNWLPVLLGFGIGLWFAWPSEPSRLAYAVTLGISALGAALWAYGRFWGRGWFWAGLGGVLLALSLFWGALGFLAAGYRSDAVAAPVIEGRYYGVIEGRVAKIDRASHSDQLRLTLGEVFLEALPPEAQPRFIRLTLHRAPSDFTPALGMRVVAIGFLSPPPAPAEPGGFDFRRMAWFDQLGAVGYTRKEIKLLEMPSAGEELIGQLRTAIARRVLEVIPGQAGAFCVAVMVGDRAAISQAVTQSLRDSTLAHILSISGLHMSLLAGFVFGAIRYGVALVPPLALRMSARKVAAVVAMAASSFYLLLSGGDVATKRAWIMIMIVLGAVLLERRVISLRSVALAALVLLLLEPEVLLEPGFQMSFAATTALVAGFAALRDRPAGARPMPRWLWPVFTLVFSSLLAGFATAPIAAAHFGRLSLWGLLANVVAVPVVGSLVMPPAVVAAVLAPVGLEALPLWVMGIGAQAVLLVSDTVAALPGAVALLPRPPMPVLPLIGLGGCWLVLWRGRMRFGGLGLGLLALLIWQQSARPQLLIAADGAIVGVMGQGGRALSFPRGGGFVAERWLEGDGEGASQTQAAARAGFVAVEGGKSLMLGAWQIEHLKGKAGLAALRARCATADLVVIDRPLPRDILKEGQFDCLIYDPRRLALTGALAVALGEDGALHVTPAAAQNRIWSGAAQPDYRLSKSGSARPNDPAP